jgi:nucleotide-binding universal stress UspA family protein
MLPPKLILAPLDFSPSSLAALEVAEELARRYGSEILLMHAVPVIPRLPDNVSILNERNYEAELIRSAEQRLAELAAQLEQSGIKARTKVGLANDAAMEIVRDSEGADLIIIATHGMTGWRRLAFGSVTEKVVRTADCPVLVLRAKASTESQETQTNTAASVSSGA